MGVLVAVGAHMGAQAELGQALAMLDHRARAHPPPRGPRTRPRQSGGPGRVGRHGTRCGGGCSRPAGLRDQVRPRDRRAPIGPGALARLTRRSGHGRPREPFAEHASSGHFRSTVHVRVTPCAGQRRRHVRQARVMPQHRRISFRGTKAAVSIRVIRGNSYRDGARWEDTMARMPDAGGEGGGSGTGARQLCGGGIRGWNGASRRCSSTRPRTRHAIRVRRRENRCGAEQTLRRLNRRA